MQLAPLHSAAWLAPLPRCAREACAAERGARRRRGLAALAGPPAFLCLTALGSGAARVRFVGKARRRSLARPAFVAGGGQLRSGASPRSLQLRSVATPRELATERVLRTAPAIAATFTPPRFVPAAYATNAHLMTVLGAEVFFTFGPDALPDGLNMQRKRYETPDGDFFDVDYAMSDGSDVVEQVPVSTRPMVVMLHGLESNSTSPVCCRMARAFLRRGFDAAVVCFRSCSGELNRTAGAYNLGFTADLDQLCAALHAAAPSRHLYLAGFSLGANVICKFLGELGKTAPARGVHGGAVCCVPFAAEDCSPLLESGIGKWVYSANFLKSLQPKAEAQAAMLKARGEPVPFDLEAVRAASTIGEFDEAFIAPIYGFQDKWDYYRRQGSKRFLGGVRVPLFAMNALDDPFIERRSLPTSADASAAVAFYYTEFGGHAGFIAQDAEQLEGSDPRNFMPGVLGDFLQHVERMLER